MKHAIAAIVFATVAVFAGYATVQAQEVNDSRYSKTVPAAFEDVFADLQDTVINRGLVIDFVGHVDDMLTRTSAAAQSITESGAKSPYLHAKYIQFCSSKLTHKAVSADPQNLAICPYIVYLYEARSKPGKVTIGYRPPVFGPSKRSGKIKVEVNDYLKSIIDDTISQQ